jgi:hypothetical protein
MAKETKKMLNLVQISEDQLYQGLSYIASNLNKIGELQGEKLSAWKEVQSIVEVMTDQPSRDTVYRKEEDYELRPLPPPFDLVVETRVRIQRDILTSKYRDRNKKPIPLPQLAINFFNQWAEKNPVGLILRIGETGIEAGHQSTTEAEGALCALWQYYFHGKGFLRLKRCPECRTWFLDDTRNAKKIRCSKRCTNKWWSRKWRKETKNKSLICEKCGKKFFPQHRIRGVLKKREACPHCGFPIDPKKRKLERIYCALFPRRLFYNDGLCPYEQGEMQDFDPSKVCAVKCDYYKASIKEKRGRFWNRLRRLERGRKGQKEPKRKGPDSANWQGYQKNNLRRKRKKASP